MPRPTVSDVHIDQALTNVSIAYRNEEYIANRVFPNIPVSKKSDYYYIFDKGAWFRDEVAVRAPGTRAKRADYSLSSASYVCLNYALGKPVPDEVRDNADNPLQPSIEAAEFVSDALLRALEKRVADVVTGSANWAYSATPSTNWSSDTSDPLGDIEAAIDGVVSRTGRKPNVGIMSWDVWRYLKNHPDILDRVKYTRPGGQTQPSDIADWFGLGRCLVGYSLYDSAKEGQTASMTYIWGNDFWTGFVPSNPALMTPAAGYTLEWKNRTVELFREDQEKQDVYTANEYTDEVITASDAGAIVYSVI